MFRPIKAVDVEVGRPLADIEGLSGYGSLHGLVRLHGAPLGYVVLPVVDGCCRKETVQEAVAELGPIARQEFEGRSSPRDMNEPELLPQSVRPRRPPTVTVAVCTRDRPQDLERCLNALCRLEYPSLDLLVVDNAPQGDATERLLNGYAPRVRYVREPRPGLDWARNRAIAETRAEILAFTDDDVIVDPEWVEALASVFVEDPQAMVVTGLVAPDSFETPAQLMFEAYGGFWGGFERRRYQINPAAGESVADRFGWSGFSGTGANMAFRRCIFDKLGGFDPALGPGTVTRGGDDLEMFFRIVKAGHVLIYEPRAVVRHRHRRTYSELRSQLTDWGIATCSFAIRSARAYPDERKPFVRACGRWALGRFRVLARSLRGRFPYPRRLILAELSGVAVGLTRYAASRRVAAKLTHG